MAVESIWKKISIGVSIALLLCSTVLVCAIIKLSSWQDKNSQLEAKLKNANGKVPKGANSDLKPVDSKIPDSEPYKVDDNLLAKLDKLEKENKDLKAKLVIKDTSLEPTNPIGQPNNNNNSPKPTTKVDELLEAKKLAEPFLKRIQEITSVSKNLSDDEFKDVMIDEAVKFLELEDNNKTLFTDMAKTIASKYNECREERNKLYKEFYSKYSHNDPKNWEKHAELQKGVQSKYSDYFGDGYNCDLEKSIEKLKPYLSEGNAKHKAFTAELGIKWIETLVTKYYYDK